MASASDILIVRGNTNQPTDAAPFTDDYIGDLIDAVGVTGASAVIWEQKAATYASAVDVTEAGASHKFSDLFANAHKMALYWRKKADEEEDAASASGRVKVKVIQRTIDGS